ncbi:MAG TPA: DUF3887 domain-containing protein [Anaerolineaceae bacterium]|nr:DUF3887 domain-containing protein [Anaerolineaceae bacterium]
MKLNRILIVFLCLCLLLGVTACGGSKLAEVFVEDDVRKAAENVITLINQQDAEGIRKLSTTQLQDALTEKVMTQIFTDIQAAGKFEKVEDMSVAGVKSQDRTEDFAVVIAKGKYESKTFIFTISFNKAMELIGLYYK